MLSSPSQSIRPRARAPSLAFRGPQLELPHTSLLPDTIVASHPNNRITGGQNVVRALMMLHRGRAIIRR